MEKCYVYFGCSSEDCPMYQRKDTKYCWEVENTLCENMGIQLVTVKLTGTKKDSCVTSGCIYYLAAQDRGIVGETDTRVNIWEKFYF